MTGSEGSSRQGVQCRVASMSRPSAVCGLLTAGFSGLHDSTFALFLLTECLVTDLFLVGGDAKECELAGSLLLSLLPREGPPRADGEVWGRLGSAAVGLVVGSARACRSKPSRLPALPLAVDGRTSSPFGLGPWPWSSAAPAAAAVECAVPKVAAAALVGLRGIEAAPVAGGAGVR